MTAPLRNAPVAADPLHPLTDDDITRFLAVLRGTSWGHPPANPAADAFVALFALVMEADPDEARDRAEEVADSAHLYATQIEEDAA